MRHDGRKPGQLRELKLKRKYTRASPGSVLISAGRTVVLCTASIDLSVPPWLKGKGQGWLTAEYNMLPGSTSPRKPRERGGKVDGRTTEIQRLIGRSLRAVVDMQALGERTITLDCDVIEADGGTRTTAINGAYVAVMLALRTLPEVKIDDVITDSVAAISIGIVDGEERLDLEYVEDRDADVDMNLVMTGTGQLIEVQGTGEEATFSRTQLGKLLDLGEAGIRRIGEMQREILSAQKRSK